MFFQPFTFGKRVYGQRVNSACQFVPEQAVDLAVPLDQLFTLKGIRDEHYLEMGF